MLWIQMLAMSSCLLGHLLRQRTNSTPLLSLCQGCRMRSEAKGFLLENTQIMEA